uniref:Uncharacterized protein n=1 Tax=Anguilla anguilla TaxID=7936 RepID=A0A0E9RAC9_ANGAN
MRHRISQKFNTQKVLKMPAD